MEKSKSIISPWLWTAIVVIILIVAGYFCWAVWNKNQPQPVATSTIEPTVDITTPIASSSDSASPISTADWKTYTNTKYNFSFKYPKDLIVVNGDTSPMNNLNSGGEIVALDSSDGKHVFGVVVNTTSDMKPTLDQEVSLIKSTTKNLDTIETSNIIIDNESAIKLIFTSLPGLSKPESELWIYVIKNSYFYTLWSRTDYSQLNDILSTFQFTP